MGINTGMTDFKNIQKHEVGFSVCFKKHNFRTEV